jgi:membrane associated rhomboid family serine protease
VDIVVRVTTSPSQAQEWALVLAAAGIPHRLEPAPPAWTLRVPDHEAPRAEAALAAYDQEARPEPPRAPADDVSWLLAWTTGIATGLLLLWFFLLTGPPSAGSRWFEHGEATAGLLWHGEPWRAVTALTLHVDAVHVVSNAVATACLLAALVPALGPGAGFLSTVLAGALGNLLSALVHEPDHVAVGASTATFGALGLLAGARVFGGGTGARAPTRPWLVLTATLVLVALLGSGPRSDQVAHGLGLVSGIVLALPAARVFRPLRGHAAVQAVLGALGVAGVVSAWLLALGGGPR